MTAENAWDDPSQKLTNLGFLTARVEEVEQGNHTVLRDAFLDSDRPLLDEIAWYRQIPVSRIIYWQCILHEELQLDSVRRCQFQWIINSITDAEKRSSCLWRLVEGINIRKSEVRLDLKSLLLLGGIECEFDTNDIVIGIIKTSKYLIRELWKSFLILLMRSDDSFKF